MAQPNSFLENTFEQFSGNEEVGEWEQFPFYPHDDDADVDCQDRPPTQPPYFVRLEPSLGMVDPAISSLLSVDFAYRRSHHHHGSGQPTQFERVSSMHPLESATPYDLRMTVSGPSSVLYQAVHAITTGGARITLWQMIHPSMEVQIPNGMEIDAAPDVQHNFTVTFAEDSIIHFQIDIGQGRFGVCSRHFDVAYFYVAVISADDQLLFSSRTTPFKLMPPVI